MHLAPGEHAQSAGARERPAWPAHLAAAHAHPEPAETERRDRAARRSARARASGGGRGVAEAHLGRDLERSTPKSWRRSNSWRFRGGVKCERGVRRFFHSPTLRHESKLEQSKLEQRSLFSDATFLPDAATLVSRSACSAHSLTARKPCVRHSLMQHGMLPPLALRVALARCRSLHALRPFHGQRASRREHAEGWR